MLTPDKRLPRAFGAVFALGLLGSLLTGCVLLEGPTPATPERETPAPPETAPEFLPDGTAQDNLPFFTEELRAYAAGSEPVQGEPIVDALESAGFDRAAMQVSFDESKTGLAADSIYVSVRFGAECLLGQLVTEDRSFAATSEPALGPHQDICLIGNTRAIDW